MPQVTVSATGQITSTIAAPGVFHSTAIALNENARGGTSIRVDTADAQVLTAGNQGCIWTDSLQICFPIIMKFRNGDIGLFHGNARTIETKSFKDLYTRADLDEILFFEKDNNRTNSDRVEFVSKGLQDYFQARPHGNQPTITIHTVADKKPYGVAVCYRTAAGPVILVGNSGGNNVMASSINDEGVAANDVVSAYHFQTVAQRYAPPPAVVPAAPPPPPPAVVVAVQPTVQQQMKESLSDMKTSGQDKKDPPAPSGGGGCCTVM